MMLRTLGKALTLDLPPHSEYSSAQQNQLSPFNKLPAILFLRYSMFNQNFSLIIIPFNQAERIELRLPQLSLFHPA